MIPTDVLEGITIIRSFFLNFHNLSRVYLRLSVCLSIFFFKNFLHIDVVILVLQILLIIVKIVTKDKTNIGYTFIYDKNFVVNLAC